VKLENSVIIVLRVKTVEGYIGGYRGGTRDTRDTRVRPDLLQLLAIVERGVA